MKHKLEKSTLFKWSYVMMALLAIVPVSVVPAMYLFGNIGLLIPAILLMIFVYAAWKVEKAKKRHQLKTYRQIVDFIEGNQIRDTSPKTKDKLFDVAIVVASAVLGFSIVYVGLTVLGK